MQQLPPNYQHFPSVFFPEDHLTHVSTETVVLSQGLKIGTSPALPNSYLYDFGFVCFFLLSWGGLCWILAIFWLKPKISPSSFGFFACFCSLTTGNLRKCDFFFFNQRNDFPTGKDRISQNSVFSHIQETVYIVTFSWFTVHLWQFRNRDLNSSSSLKFLWKHDLNLLKIHYCQLPCLLAFNVPHHFQWNWGW